MGLAKAEAHFFKKFTNRAALIFVECSQLLEQRWINLNV
jgi:hypothetical protein